jgi:hypothetical protein
VTLPKLAAAATLVLLAQYGRPPRVHVETEHAIVEYEPGDLTPAQAAAFAALADRGVADVESLVAPALPAWARRSIRLRFIVTSRVRMSRTFHSTILLPASRVISHRAPYLHETVHALVPFRGSRVWLSEGLASYLESWVAENRGGYDSHVFTRAGDRGIDRAARAWLRRAEGRAVLPWVGRPGEPPRLEEDRSGVARPFYVLSQSLTRHLVDAVGLARVVPLVVAGGQPEAFERETGRSEARWRAEWLEALGEGSLAAEPDAGRSAPY